MRTLACVLVVLFSLSACLGKERPATDPSEEGVTGSPEGSAHGPAAEGTEDGPAPTQVDRPVPSHGSVLSTFGSWYRVPLATDADGEAVAFSVPVPPDAVEDVEGVQSFAVEILPVVEAGSAKLQSFGYFILRETEGALVPLHQTFAIYALTTTDDHPASDGDETVSIAPKGLMHRETLGPGVAPPDRVYIVAAARGSAGEPVDVALRFVPSEQTRPSADLDEFMGRLELWDPPPLDVIRHGSATLFTAFVGALASDDHGIHLRTTTSGPVVASFQGGMPRISVEFDSATSWGCYIPMRSISPAGIMTWRLHGEAFGERVDREGTLIDDPVGRDPKPTTYGGVGGSGLTLTYETTGSPTWVTFHFGIIGWTLGATPEMLFEMPMDVEGQGSGGCS
ncbi:MAG: hypothetical protein KY455_10410 [Euryarchaeota archaeon]|nr:hypothetical protein [Euryarchaeota archaeon]